MPVSSEKADVESIFRPLYISKHFSATDGVKIGAFEPPPDKTDISVIDGTDLPFPDKLPLCQTAMTLINEGRSNPFKMKAWCELNVDDVHHICSNIEGVNLSTVRDDDPFDRHTNLQGFPLPDPDSKLLAIMESLRRVCYYQRVDEKNQTLKGVLTKNPTL